MVVILSHRRRICAQPDDHVRAGKETGWIWGFSFGLE